MAFGIPYITPDEFTSTLQGLSVTGLTTENIDDMIKDASRIAEAVAGGTTWFKEQLVERWEYKLNNRLYLRKWPIVSIDTLKLFTGATTFQTFATTDAFVNNQGRYVEIASLTFATELSGSLISLGLMTPTWEVTYTAGYDTIPDDVKLAVGIITGAKIAQFRLAEEGIAGVLSFIIGSYQVTVGRGQSDAAGFAGLVPSVARDLLNDYRMTNVR